METPNARWTYIYAGKCACGIRMFISYVTSCMRAFHRYKLRRARRTSSHIYRYWEREMKVIAVLVVGATILSLADADVCTYDAAIAYGTKTFASNLNCSISLLHFLQHKDTTQQTLSIACDDTCAGVLYRWYLQNCQGNLLNATLLSDACSKNSNGAYCAQAAANINTTLMAGCVQTINTGNCSAAGNCKTLFQASLSGLGCCYNSTTSNQTFAALVPSFQSCDVATITGTCNAPFTSAAPALAANLLLLMAVVVWIR